ncbi:hypothetical protein HOP50_04g32150 [Chloropicon primus]|uniref:Uncharacterized protein n=1 Tax=Chloropicon primus TaxID=1764295 RepID=A0A5B8MJQ2_9CHLO|nr:hypothetical protein A3770_04p32110 [Chloropicon primus]UPQ99905.1 hypothetical protein HOP50_04g32150 [Chloropicon primus]|eukprot:QDZ20693.1 hypothetical protein A3770_04p32110 [Chloropicon primus]
MKSGGGVLCISVLQLVVGLVLLGIYEAYKKEFFRVKVPATVGDGGATGTVLTTTSTPMDIVFFLSLLNNTFAFFGLAGVINSQKEMVTAFFSYNIVQIVLSFHLFVDVAVDTTIKFPRESGMNSGYETAAAVFVFFNFLLSISATYFAVQAVSEIKEKTREEYSKLSTVLDDALPG